MPGQSLPSLLQTSEAAPGGSPQLPQPHGSGQGLLSMPPAALPHTTQCLHAGCPTAAILRLPQPVRESSGTRWRLSPPPKQKCHRATPTQGEPMVGSPIPSVSRLLPPVGLQASTCSHSGNSGMGIEQKQGAELPGSVPSGQEGSSQAQGQRPSCLRMPRWCQNRCLPSHRHFCHWTARSRRMQ